MLIIINKKKTSLKDIKEILLYTDFYTSNTIQNNKRERNGLAEPTTSIVREQNFEVAKIKTSLKKISKQCAVAECDLEAARWRVNKQQDVIYKLYHLQDKLKQYMRKTPLKYMVYQSESAYSTTDQVEVILR